MKINHSTKILVIDNIPQGAYKYQYAFDSVPRTIERDYPTRIVHSDDLTPDTFKKAVTEFEPELIFCYLQHPGEVLRVADLLNGYHPVPAINWYLEDPNNVVVDTHTGSHILDAAAQFDGWFSQDRNMLPFWKTKAFFMPPGFDGTLYSDLRLPKRYEVSYIGQLGPSYVTAIYWPYMKELARYGKRAMLCIDRPMGLPLLPKPMEKFIRSRKRRKMFQALPFWKCGWTNPEGETEKCRIINQSKIHFGMVRLRGEWEAAFRRLLPDYPVAGHGLFYQLKGRLFQGVGAGAMMLNEYCPELEELFEIGREIVTFEYGDVQGMRDKLAWYIAHDAEREKIARAGYERGRKEHTFACRVEQILDIVRKEF